LRREAHDLWLLRLRQQIRRRARAAGAVSSDKLHRKTAPLFTRPNQEFVWGHDLKPALKAVNDHFLELPEAERERGS
jgi:hypothetical protein